MPSASIVNVERLRFFIKNDINVILVGRHGVGKTSMVRQAFIEEGLRYRIYSAATMDPWVDFIGIPRAVPNGHGNMQRGCEHPIKPDQALPMCLECGAPLFVPVDDEMVLKLARPQEWAHNDVQAVMFDEFNRSPKKVRNAVMELIQFKSINDRPFPNLKIVWAAINPDEDEDAEYDVEPVDPAQKDRFHVWLEIPYKPNRKYFSGKFGPEVTSTAIDWWNRLPDGKKDGTENIKIEVSPRRLDYALEVWKKGGHLEDVLPLQSNVAALRNALKTTPVMEELRGHFTTLKTAQEAVAAGKKPKTPVDEIEQTVVDFLADENNYSLVIKEIVGKSSMISVFVPLMPEEKISDLLYNEQMVRNHYLRNFSESDVVLSIMEQIVESGTNTSTAREIGRVLKRAKLDRIKTIDSSAKPNPNRTPNYTSAPTNANFSSVLQALKGQTLDDTYARTGAYQRIESQIPGSMPLADVLDCLTMLNTLVQRSHGKTVRSWTNLIGMINTCMENLIQAKWDFSEFTKKFPKLAAHVINAPGFYFQVT